MAVSVPVGVSGGTDGDEVIGEYVQLGFVGDLTEDHVESTQNGFRAEAPTGTDEIHVDRAYIRDRLGPWGADHPFTLDSGRVVADAGTVAFTRFQPNATPTYTLGSSESIRFAERPMWLSIEDHADGSFNLTADAANTTGQPVRVNASWLWRKGIYAPSVVHEDGFTVPVEWTAGGRAYRAEVPHFSEVRWDPSGLDVSAELDVKIRIDGLLSGHTGDEIWDTENRTLYIDIGDYLTEIDVLVEQSWIDNNIDNLAVWQRNVTNETVDGTDYYVSSLTADDTPTLHVLREYQASNKWMFTRGNRSNVYVGAVPRFVNVTEEQGNLNVSVRPNRWNGTYIDNLSQIGFNLSYLSDFGIDSPAVYNGTNRSLPLAYSNSSRIVQARGGWWTNTSNEDDGSYLRNQYHVYEPPGVPGVISGCGEGDWEHLKTWDTPDAHVDSFVYNGMFCWSWTASPDNLYDPDWYTVYFSAWDPDVPSYDETGGCWVSPESDSENPQKSGTVTCEWPQDAANPDEVELFVRVMAKEGSHFDNGQQKKSDDQCKGPGGATAVTIFDIDLTLLSSLCRFIFPDEDATESYDYDDGSYCCELEGLLIDTQIVRADSYVQGTIDLENKDRDDTWDALEKFGHRTANWKGPQGLNWEIWRANDAKMVYDTNVTELLSVSKGDNSLNYGISWTEEAPDLTAEDRTSDTETRWTTTIDLTLDWEVKEPAPPLDLILQNGQNDSLALSNTWNTSVPSTKNATWWEFTVLDTTLPSAEINETGNISVADVGTYGNITMALAHRATANETFLNSILEPVYLNGPCGPDLEDEVSERFLARSTGVGTTWGQDLKQKDDTELSITFRCVGDIL